jgi:hypothetical protein
MVPPIAGVIIAENFERIGIGIGQIVTLTNRGCGRYAVGAGQEYGRNKKQGDNK